MGDTPSPEMLMSDSNAPAPADSLQDLPARSKDGVVPARPDEGVVTEEGDVKGGLLNTQFQVNTLTFSSNATGTG
jgi:hypothetical protein